MLFLTSTKSGFKSGIPESKFSNPKIPNLKICEILDALETTQLHDLANIETVKEYMKRLSLTFEQNSRLVDNPLINSLYD